MHSSSGTDPEQCPVCYEEFDNYVVLKKGISFQDLTPYRPSTFFRKYIRRCSHPMDVVNDEEYGGDKIVLYFHSPQNAAHLL